jgi:aminoglycoside 6'-N-acetyltransferase
VAELFGERVRLRQATASDQRVLVAIRSTPEVRQRWGGTDLESEFLADLETPELHLLAIEDEGGAVVGAIQWEAEDDPDYRHASIDIYLDPAHHGRGLCTDAVSTLARYLINIERFHRLVIDPAADNAAAIRCYEKVGFRRVGVMRRYERGRDGSWHDGLLMDLLAAEVAPTRGPAEASRRARRRSSVDDGGLSSRAVVRYRRSKRWLHPKHARERRPDKGANDND